MSRISSASIAMLLTFSLIASNMFNFVTPMYVDFQGSTQKAVIARQFSKGILITIEFTGKNREEFLITNLSHHDVALVGIRKIIPPAQPYLGDRNYRELVAAEKALQEQERIRTYNVKKPSSSITHDFGTIRDDDHFTAFFKGAGQIDDDEETQVPIEFAPDQDP